MNTQRRKKYIDGNGKMFIPMNVEGGTWNEHFITTPKLIVIITILVVYFLIALYLSSSSVKAGWFAYVFYYTIWTIISTLMLRFIVFEERFYYQMYKKLQKNEITTPALFWDVVTINDTYEGAIITYSDAKIAVCVKLDRDTITGKGDDFQEEHYDAISDFYKALAEANYSFVQMNLMETAGKDPRLSVLSKLMTKSKNENVRKLMELQIGHIKNMTNRTLCESDYFVFYTRELAKMDSIIDDVQDCLGKLRDGAYTGWTVLNKKEIVDLVKELYGINYFNATDASLKQFNDDPSANIRPIMLESLVWTDGNVQKLSNAEVNRLRKLTSDLISGAENMSNVSLKETFYKKDKSSSIGVDLDKIIGDDEDDDLLIDYGSTGSDGSADIIDFSKKRGNSNDDIIDFSKKNNSLYDNSDVESGVNISKTEDNQDSDADDEIIDY